MIGCGILLQLNLIPFKSGSLKLGRFANTKKSRKSHSESVGIEQYIIGHSFFIYGWILTNEDSK